MINIIFQSSPHTLRTGPLFSCWPDSCITQLFEFVFLTYAARPLSLFLKKNQKNTSTKSLSRHSDNFLVKMILRCLTDWSLPELDLRGWRVDANRVKLLASPQEGILTHGSFPPWWGSCSAACDCCTFIDFVSCMKYLKMKHVSCSEVFGWNRFNLNPLIRPEGQVSLTEEQIQQHKQRRLPKHL